MTDLARSDLSHLKCNWVRILKTFRSDKNMKELTVWKMLTELLLDLGTWKTCKCHEFRRTWKSYGKVEDFFGVREKLNTLKFDLSLIRKIENKWWVYTDKFVNLCNETFWEFTSSEFSKLDFVRLSSVLTEDQFIYWTSGVWQFNFLDYPTL